MHKSVFSVDVEEWFHILDVPSTPALAEWGALESRVEKSFRSMLEVFAEKQVRTTLFFLAWVVERYPHLVREAVAGGHEIASHGYAHELVYRQDRTTFSADISKAKDIIEQAAGSAVRGYRAPGFSVTEGTPWFFDAVAEAGYTYDSSVFPGERGHGGLPGALAIPHLVNTSEGDLVEFPISLSSMFGKPMYFFGGGYLRFFPYRLMLSKAKAVLKEERPVVFYLHPREVDPGHPRLPMSAKRNFMTYHNLRSTMPKMRRLFEDLPMTTFGDIVDAGTAAFPRAPR
ncbi:MAG: polysaccharide deacetylase family protein [Flavobacteriales bacterium]|nr:polysaccharide deacetylase family protein [Flavobacteriales bacterium]QQS72358.1 MAG: polysaccharide deacetylase family protein [Flavobacteriales bacterium]HQV39197.1 polysaccharide deacetylase family protein [Flavobacteriales bacterium]HQW32331.1 polysaccharide deacetylase family protein [Flavobacteriales bacterium]HQY03520.1 polysaccharide deacetylase family protein [Flavobacteriales bacterium]